MSTNKQRKARERSRRERLERQRQQEVTSRHRRTVVVLGLALAAVIAALVILAVSLTGDSRPDLSAEDTTAENSEFLEAEAAAEANSAAVTEAMAAGDVVAEDYTLEPGTAVDSGQAPVADDRPVACGATAPTNALETRRRYPGGPADVLDDGVDYVARIETSCGPIVIDLLEGDAPKAVNSFVFLAEEGFYDGLEVFRDFGGIAAAQGGSGNNTVTWDIGYRLPDELELPKREGYPIGTVTTVEEGPDTAGSQFMIAYGKEFDAGFRTDRTQTTFGRVLSGMEVIYTMTAMERVTMGGEAYAKRLFMESISIERR